MFEQHSPRVFAYARRHSDAGSAQDVVAETFLIAWRRRDSVPDEALPWLLVTARNVLANRRRHQARQDRLLDAVARLEHLAAPVASADQSVLERDTFLAALGRLNDTEREALLLIAWDGLSITQAAVVAGCSRRAFEVRLSRARARLTAAMSAESPPPQRRVTRSWARPRTPDIGTTDIGTTDIRTPDIRTTDIARPVDPRTR